MGDELFYKVSVPLVTIDSRSSIVRWNRSFEKLTGLQADEISGRSFLSLCSSQIESQARSVFDSYFYGDTSEFFPVETTLDFPELGPLTVPVYIHFIPSNDPARSELTIQLDNITEYKYFERRESMNQMTDQALNNLASMLLSTAEGKGMQDVADRIPGYITEITGLQSELVWIDPDRPGGELAQTHYMARNSSDEEISVCGKDCRVCLSNRNVVRQKVYNNTAFNSILSYPVVAGDQVVGRICMEAPDKKGVEWSGSFLERAANFLAFSIQRQKYELKLVETLRNLESVSRARSSFMGKISHELRTPLNSIIGFAEILRGKSTEKTNLEYLERIEKSGQYLLSMINGIIDLVSLESDTLEIHPSRTDVLELLDEVKSSFSYEIVSKDLDFVFRSAFSRIQAILDEFRFRQIILNLISNAIKFTDEGQVTVNVYATFSGKGKGNLIVDVRDSGPGINLDLVESEFLFFQEKIDVDTSPYAGAGMGLAITDRLVEIMGGHIDLSTRPGVGSVFRVVLPGVVVEVDGPGVQTDFREVRYASRVSEKIESQLLKRMQVLDIPEQLKEQIAETGESLVIDEVLALVQELGYYHPKDLHFQNTLIALKKAAEHFQLGQMEKQIMILKIRAGMASPEESEY